MEKVIREGQVAVLVSPGHGAGWYSWHGVEALLYDPVVVDMVEHEHGADAITAHCDRQYGTDKYYGGADSLVVEWVPAGSKFCIEEYDGAEVLVTEELLLARLITA